MPATFKEDPIARGERYTIDQLLADFDVQRWSVACREMQVRIMRGHIAAAHQVIDAFARHQSYETATMQSSVGSVLPVRIANALEAVGCMTVTAVDRMSDDELEEIDTIGEGAVELIRRVIGQIKRGETIERFEEDDDLLDPDCFVSRLTASICQCHTSPTPQPQTITRATEMSTNADQVLQALELLAESGDTAAEVIDKQIAKYDAEIQRLKRMRRLLVNTQDARKNSPTRNQDLESQVYQYISEHGPTTSYGVAKALGTYPVAVGKVVASSNRLTKLGANIIIG